MTIIYKNPDGSFTKEVVMYKPNQPTVSHESGDLVWGELVVDDDASLPHHASLYDDSGFSHCANQDDSAPHLSQLLSPVSSQVFSPLSSPVHTQVFPPPPQDGGRRCSKNNKNKNRSMTNRSMTNRLMKNRNRSMKNAKRKTIRNKRKRKNRSVRRRG
jgi:hypothetical protein